MWLGLAVVFVLMSFLSAWVFGNLARMYQNHHSITASEHVGNWFAGCALYLGGMALSGFFLILAVVALLAHSGVIGRDMNLISPANTALRPGMTVVVAPDQMTPVRVDEQGRPGAQLLMMAPQGLKVTIVEGRTEHGGQKWWKIRTSAGHVGWILDTTPTGMPVLARR